MNFVTTTDWEITRVDMRPEIVDTNGLLVDNVNLQFKSTLTITGNKVCIEPIILVSRPPPKIPT